MVSLSALPKVVRQEGSGVSFQNINNIVLGGQATFPKGVSQSKTLVLSDFRFDLPEKVFITSFAIQLMSGGEGFDPSAIYLVNPNPISANAVGRINSVYKSGIYQSDSDGWDVELTPSLINSTDFGFSIKGTNSKDRNSSTLYDPLITVFYSDAASGLISAQVGGDWRNAIAYAKANNLWKRVDKVFVNVNGSWKEVPGGYSNEDDPRIIMKLLFEDSGDGYTLTDETGVNPQFTRVGDAHLSPTQKKFGNTSAYFDGTGDYYSSNGRSLYQMFGDFTVELWFYPTVYGTASIPKGIISYQSTETGAYPSIMINNLGNLQMRRGANVIISGETITSLNEWHHLSFGRVDGEGYLYLDGELQGVAELNTSVNAPLCALGTLGWLRDETANGKFRGYIDDLTWWRGISIRDGERDFIPPFATTNTPDPNTGGGEGGEGGHPANP